MIIVGPECVIAISDALVMDVNVLTNNVSKFVVVISWLIFVVTFIGSASSVNPLIVTSSLGNQDVTFLTSNYKQNGTSANVTGQFKLTYAGQTTNQLQL